jgi:alkylation response protein AidB-like acyl-CoA dehydrogenase
VLAFEELGKALVPGPLAWSHLAAGLVPGAADASTVVGGLDLRDGAGAPYVVEHLESLDALLLLRTDGVERVDPRAVEAKRLATPLDPLTPVHQVGELPPGEHIADGDEGRRLRLVGAALVAGEAALKNTRACIQVHGGMGYTWEVPAHYFLKRSWVLESVFGTVDEHADGVAEKIA